MTAQGDTYHERQRTLKQTLSQAMFKFIYKMFKINKSASKALQGCGVTVSFDEYGITSKHNGTENGRVKWSDIELIAISIEDDFLPFPYWYIGGKDNLLRIPNDAVGAGDLFFDGLAQYIDGYGTDETYQVILEASSAMQGSFIVWQAAEPLPA